MTAVKAKESSTIKIGNTKIAKGPGTSHYIPKNASLFVDHGDILKTLAIGVNDNMPVLIIGESGVGKTSAIRYLANLTNNGLRRVNLNGGTTADELVGRILINEKGTYWVDGILTEAMRNGDWVVFDEINAALPEVLLVLQSVLDDDGYLVLTEKNDKEIVFKHPNFRFFATCNPPEYAGTKEMNKALLSRFGICINAEFPTEKVELEIISHHLGQAVAESEMATRLVKMANETRKTKESGTSDFAINTRDILNTLRLVENMEPMEAVCLAFINKLENSDGKALKAMAKLQLPQTKKAATSIRKPINTVDDIVIGNTYVMDADAHNTYFGLTTDVKAFDTLTKSSLNDFISQTAQENAVKNDEFVVEGAYYQTSTKAEKKEVKGQGDKIASLVNIVNGANKGKKAMIIHHAAIENTIDIVKSIYQITSSSK